MKAIVVTDQAAGTAGMKLVERPEPDAARLASLSGANYAGEFFYAEDYHQQYLAAKPQRLLQPQVLPGLLHRSEHEQPREEWFVSHHLDITGQAAPELVAAPVPHTTKETPPMTDTTDPRPSDELRVRLTPEQYHVTQEAGTERAFTGEYWDTKDPGVYRCVVCDTGLFDSDHKFDSGTGWPSFNRDVRCPSERGRLGSAPRSARSGARSCG